MRLHGDAVGSAVGPVILELEANEARALRAALGEVCFGFHLEDFHGRIGMGEEGARALFGRLDGLDLGRGGIIQATKAELVAMWNAQAETLRELGVEEYSTRTGVQFDEGQNCLRHLGGLLREMSETGSRRDASRH